jgi:hypothetical protein
VKRYSGILVGLVLCALALGGCDTGSATGGTAGTAVRCGGHFEAVVDQGPDKGLSVVGTLTIDVDANGSMSGTLQPTSGANIAVIGQVTGRAINLAMDLGGGKSMFGTGTLFNPISQCSGTAGGPLVGPEIVATGEERSLHPATQGIVERNHGVWGYAIGGSP